MKDRESIKWLYKITKKQIPNIILLSLNNAVLALIGVAVALLSKKIVDVAVEIAATSEKADRDYTMLIVFGVAMLAAITARVLVRIFTQSLSVKVQAKMEMGMREKMFHSILGKPYEKVSEYHSGELMNRLTSDIGIVSNGMVTLIPDTTFIVVQFTSAMAVLVLFDWKFALVFAVGGVAIAVIVSKFRRKLKQLHKEVQETSGKARSFFQEAIESLLVIKTFGIEDVLEKKGDALQDDNYEAKMKRRKVSIYANSGFGFVFNIGYLYALLWCSIKLCEKTMTYGTLTAVLQLISQVQAPFANITKVFPQLFGIIASAERIMEIEKITAEEKSDEKIDIQHIYENLDSISFSDVKFSYSRDTVLEGGSAEIKKGDFVAIRGISGIGKSTLLKMLLGVFSPKGGEISINLTDGTTVPADMNTRELFSYVPQGNYLFSGTLKENLYLVRPDATEKEIEEALKISDCKPFVDKLPEGLDTVIGEKGLGLSEGQIQRMAIARAVLSKSPIILLDEATSALDAETEENVLNNIKALKNRTCVIITHKTAALKVCNRELIIQNKILSQEVKMHICPSCGRIVEKEAKYCTHCGEELTKYPKLAECEAEYDFGCTMTNCPVCNTYNSMINKYCSQCGAKMR